MMVVSVSWSYSCHVISPVAGSVLNSLFMLASLLASLQASQDSLVSRSSLQTFPCHALPISSASDSKASFSQQRILHVKQSFLLLPSCKSYGTSLRQPFSALPPRFQT